MLIIYAQVLACVLAPELITSSSFPEDVKERATGLLKSCG